MNKSELIKTLAEETNIPVEDATLVVNTFIDNMKDALIAGDRVEIQCSGRVTTQAIDDYSGPHPLPGESVHVNSKRTPFFRAVKELKEYLNDQ